MLMLVVFHEDFFLLHLLIKFSKNYLFNPLKGGFWRGKHEKLGEFFAENRHIH